MPAILSSNNGEAQFVIELRASAEYARDMGYQSSIYLRGQHWDGDHTFPFSTSITGLWLRASDLTAFREHISRWLSQPLDDLIAENLRADFQLAQLPNQSVRVRFGPQSERTSDLNPVITVTFSVGALRGEFHFITDQSCLTLFVQELSAELLGSHKAFVE